MSYGGEDTELAHRFKLANKRIVFVPAAEIAHPARTSVGEFTRWLFVRGRAKRQFSRKVSINGYVGARLVSYGRIVRANLHDPKIVVILPLLAASILLQEAGFLAETFSARR
jgi:GT2 family glycosyltransferase